MVHKKRHHFLAQFSIPFHMVWSVWFLSSVSSKKHLLTGWNYWTPNQKPLLNVFWRNGEHYQQNGAHHVKRNGNCEKLFWKMMSLLVYQFVCGHLGVLQVVVLYSHSYVLGWLIIWKTNCKNISVTLLVQNRQVVAAHAVLVVAQTNQGVVFCLAG